MEQQPQSVPQGPAVPTEPINPDSCVYCMIVREVDAQDAAVEFTHVAGEVLIACSVCGARSPGCRDMDEAARLWNAMQRALRKALARPVQLGTSVTVLAKLASEWRPVHLCETPGPDGCEDRCRYCVGAKSAREKVKDRVRGIMADLSLPEHVDPETEQPTPSSCGPMIAHYLIEIEETVGFLGGDPSVELFVAEVRRLTGMVK